MRGPDGLLIQFQEFTWTPDGVHQEAWLSVRPSKDRTRDRKGVIDKSLPDILTTGHSIRILRLNQLSRLPVTVNTEVRYHQKLDYSLAIYIPSNAFSYHLQPPLVMY